MLLKNGIDLNLELSDYISKAHSLFIYSAYIKLETLKTLIGEQSNVKAVYVRWETKDLITGASDLEIYPFCAERGISLFRNKRLHFKAFVNNYSSCLMGSCNISGRGLNIPNNDFYNYELATIVDNLSFEDKLYFSIIEQDSILITDNIYGQIKEQLPQKVLEYPNEEDFELKLTLPDKNFLISSLPMTYSVETLYRIYEDKKWVNDVELNCATHDLAIYKIPFSLETNEFKRKLKIEFFNHPFIKAFLEIVNIKGEFYFGESKAWIHANCSNVPTPRRWEVTENIQILFRWIVKLSDGKYQIDRPNHSERLFFTSNKH